jgi:hypothetical protein
MNLERVEINRENDPEYLPLGSAPLSLRIPAMSIRFPGDPDQHSGGRRSRFRAEDDQ